MATPAAIKARDITRFDTGLLSIESLEGLKQAALPLTGRITPSDDTIESFIQRIFELPTVRQQLLRELKPRLSNRRILAPNVYYPVADGMENWLKSMASTTDNPQLRQLFEDAASFFKDETQLRDMLNEFLLALQQG